MTVSRRTVLLATAAGAVGGAAATYGGGWASAQRVSDPTWRMPAEGHPHLKTVMTWPTRRIWGGELPAVRSDIAGIANAIAEFEPVTLLANGPDVASAERACGSGVDVVELPVDDLWARDTGPVFVLGPDGIAGVDLNFNGWGGKQEHGRDGAVARRLLGLEGIPRIEARVVAEGGAIEVDGEGTLLAAESSLVNDNRNPGMTRADVERELSRLFGITKVLWVKGLKGEDITDYHIDGLARFADPGVVVISTPAPDAPHDIWFEAYEQARGVLSAAVDAHGRRLELVDLPEPTEIGPHSPDFVATYVNYYVANGAVIAQRFGDRKADGRAAAILRELHPGREVVQLSVDHVAAGGGGVHCATQQLPQVSPS